ncbi:unnamed protein product [Ilex paraguariensis]|uniref:Uncharacterized protein n=1 Tax=Ilex paraguariensis TaxID=185542 RepID=A0ABC8U0X8_9AQUA
MVGSKSAKSYSLVENNDDFTPVSESPTLEKAHDHVPVLSEPSNLGLHHPNLTVKGISSLVAMVGKMNQGRDFIEELIVFPNNNDNYVSKEGEIGEVGKYLNKELPFLANGGESSIVNMVECLETNGKIFRDLILPLSNKGKDKLLFVKLMSVRILKGERHNYEEMEEEGEEFLCKQAAKGGGLFSRQIRWSRDVLQRGIDVVLQSNSHGHIDVVIMRVTIGHGG